VRGDSRRDFYAKSLALAGLGMLAAAGAAVDYWPVGGSLPVVSAADLPTPDAPRLVQDLTREIPAPTIAVAVARVVPPEPTLPFLEVPVADAALPVADMSEVDLMPAPIALPAPLPVLVAHAGATPTMDGWTVALLGPPAMPGPGGPASLVTGAHRKTGSSLADAFRGVFGAFKKVSPF
jgi:hypothetical protein